MRPWIATVIAGLVCGLAPLDTPLGGPMWLVGLVAAGFAVEGHVGRDLGRGWLWGLLWYGVGLSWIAGSWSDLDGSLTRPWLAWAAVTALQALVPAAGLGLAGALKSRGWPWPAAVALGWAAAEAVGAWVQPLPGGLALFMSPIQPLLWPAALGGVTAWLLVAGAWVGLVRTRPTWGLAVLVAWFAVGTSWWPQPGEPLRVGLVQPNTGGFDGRRASTAIHREERLLRLISAAQAGGAHVVLTPEGAWPHTLDLRRERTHLELTERFADRGPVLLGASLDEGDRRSNSALAIDDGRVIDRVDKVHLVPVSERAIVGVGTDLFHPGAPRGPVHLAGATVSVRICFEDLIPAALRRLGPTDLVVAASNDAWLGERFGSRQHDAGSRLAAVLTGRWLVRPTNNGRSAVYDPTGRRRWQAPWVDGDAHPDHPGFATVQTIERVRPWWTGADVDPWLALLVTLLTAGALVWPARRLARPAVDARDTRLNAE